MSDLAGVKAAVRKAAFARRKAAFAEVDMAPAQVVLGHVLAAFAGRVVSGYLPIRTEIDPRPALAEATDRSPVCMPVIDGRARPLRFRAWHPGAELAEGPFGTGAPAEGRFLVPDVLVVPLLAFDRSGARLGYGGGYYDRTLEGLRHAGRPVAVGFAYAAQEVDAVPVEPTDQRLDAVVTEEGLIPMPGGIPLAVASRPA